MANPTAAQIERVRRLAIGGTGELFGWDDGRVLKLYWHGAAMDAADNQVEVLDATGAVVASLAGSKSLVARGILKTIQDRLIK